MNNKTYIQADKGDRLSELNEANEEAKRKAEERERLLKKRNGEKVIDDSWWVKPDVLKAHCPHCGFRVEKSIVSGLNYYYCKRCEELQPATTKEVVETVTEREYRDFWQWIRHKPASIKRTIHAEIVERKPQCHICKRSDMMVPFDQKHCPVCGNLMEREVNGWLL